MQGKGPENNTARKSGTDVKLVAAVLVQLFFGWLIVAGLVNWVLGLAAVWLVSAVFAAFAVSLVYGVTTGRIQLRDVSLIRRYTGTSRPPIPQGVKKAVWARDGGRCVYCGDASNLEFDHVIPYSKGGADSVENLQILCRRCNRSKGANI